MVWRYSLLFAPIQLEVVKREMRNLCVLRMIHGFAESMPLLIIQTYIACMSPSSVEEINVISMALSLFNVCWALASFTKNIRSHNVHRLVLTWIGVIFQFMWRLGTITSRVLVLVLYSTVFTYWVFLVVVLHWITMMLWVLSRYATLKSERLTPSYKVFLSVFVSYIHIFCYLNLEEQNTKLKIITFYTIMLVENILLIALWTLGLQETQPGWEGTNRHRIYIAVFASFFIGIFFMIVYYKFFHVRKLSATLSYSPNDGDTMKTRKLHEHQPPHSHHASNSSAHHGPTPAVTVFNCALNPALRKKKKLASRSVPPPPPPPVPSTPSATAAPVPSGNTMASTPFWKEPLPLPEERTAGDGLSYSRTTSVDDIRQKLQEKRDKQLIELRRIEQDIVAGKVERHPPLHDDLQPIPVIKRQPVVLISDDEGWRSSIGDSYFEQSMEPTIYQERPTYLGVTQPSYPEVDTVTNPGLYSADQQNHVRQYGVAPREPPPYPPDCYNPLQFERLSAYPGNNAELISSTRRPPYHSTPIYPAAPQTRIQDGSNVIATAASNNMDTSVYQSQYQGNYGYGMNRTPISSRDVEKFYSYKDSSGDQGDIDSGDDVASHPGSGQPALPPRLPLPLPRSRVVIGGYDHETPL